MRISDWSSDVCSSDLWPRLRVARHGHAPVAAGGIELHRDHRGAPGPARVLPGGDCLQQRMDRCRAARGARQAADQERLRAIPARPGRPRIRAMKVIETALPGRSEEHTSELQSLMRISYAVFCLKKKKNRHKNKHN